MGYYVPVPAEHNLDPIKKRTDQQPGFEYTSETIFVEIISSLVEQEQLKTSGKFLTNRFSLTSFGYIKK